MSLICRSCEQPPGSLHLEHCPLKQPFLGAIVSVFECIQTNTNVGRRKEDKT